MANEHLIEGRSLSAWNKSWEHLPCGLRQRHPDLQYLVGVFQVRLGGIPMYVGCATEFANGGIDKRLGDFTRPASGGRDHYAGELIHQHRDEVEIYLIVTGIDETAAWTAKRVKHAMLKAERLPWNARQRHAGA